METNEKEALFTAVSEVESASVSGGETTVVAKVAGSNAVVTSQGVLVAQLGSIVGAIPLIPQSSLSAILARLGALSSITGS